MLRKESVPELSFFARAQQFFSARNCIIGMNVGWNLIVGTLVLQRFLTDPTASRTELGFDILVHYGDALLKSGLLNKKYLDASIYLNLGRELSIIYHTLAGNSTISTQAVLTDFFANHPFNLAATYLAKDEEEKQASIQSLIHKH